jgi:hypothetical protein
VRAALLAIVAASVSAKKDRFVEFVLRVSNIYLFARLLHFAAEGGERLADSATAASFHQYQLVVWICPS